MKSAQIIRTRGFRIGTGIAGIGLIAGAIVAASIAGSATTQAAVDAPAPAVAVTPTVASTQADPELAGCEDTLGVRVILSTLEGGDEREPTVFTVQGNRWLRYWDLPDPVNIASGQGVTEVCVDANRPGVDLIEPKGSNILAGMKADITVDGPDVDVEFDGNPAEVKVVAYYASRFESYSGRDQLTIYVNSALD